MKKLLIILVLSLVVNLYGQDYYMYVNGEKHTFGVSETKLMIKIRNVRYYKYKKCHTKNSFRQHKIR